MILLTFDISRKATGYAVGETEIEDSGSFSCKHLSDAYKHFNRLLRQWKPDVVSWAKATRFYNAQRAQARVEGVLLLSVENYVLAGGKKPQIIDSLVDSQAKKHVLGSGKATKAEICEWAKVYDEDCADAKMLWTFTYEVKID